MNLLLILFSVLTTYTHSVFHTEASVVAHTPAWNETATGLPACSNAVDSVIAYVQLDPLRLSEWAFAGMGHQEDTRRDAVYLVWKESTYDAAKRHSTITFDILVNGTTMFRNVRIESIVRDSLYQGGRTIWVDIFYSGSLLKQASGVFHLLPQSDGSVQIIMNTDIRFGWFFNIFITRKVFRETIEWRLERFVQNIALEAQGTRPSDDYWQKRDEARPTNKKK